MFTGIVQTQADVLSANIKNNLLKLKIGIEQPFIQGLQLGASVSNNGVCLTVTKFGDLSESLAFIDFDVIDETLRVTNLGGVNVGDSINIERSLKVGDELGGHIVSGHVHFMTSVKDIIKTTDNCKMIFTCPSDKTQYLFDKGFVTVNGTSLTIGEVVDNTFSVHLIPETLNITNLGQLSINDAVNIELDQQTITIVDTISRLQKKL